MISANGTSPPSSPKRERRGGGTSGRRRTKAKNQKKEARPSAPYSGKESFHTTSKKKTYQKRTPDRRREDGALHRGDTGLRALREPSPGVKIPARTPESGHPFPTWRKESEHGGYHAEMKKKTGRARLREHNVYREGGPHQHPKKKPPTVRLREKKVYRGKR